MGAAVYWAQWGHEEILSMYGVELDEDCDKEPEDEEQEKWDCCSSGCMDCLGLSWRDFM